LTATSAPKFFAAAHFSAEPAVVMTLPPNALASMIAVVPMPDVPPCTSTQSPGFTSARINMFCQQVKNVSGSAAASLMESVGGTGSACGS
jgi:hypothetical protein